MDDNTKFSYSKPPCNYFTVNLHASLCSASLCMKVDFLTHFVKNNICNSRVKIVTILYTMLFFCCFTILVLVKSGNNGEYFRPPGGKPGLPAGI